MAGAPASPGSPWLHGPASDLLLGAGLIYLPVFAALCVAGETLRTALPATLMPLLMVLFNAPHLGATLLRVYERAEDRRRYQLFSVYATALIAVTFGAGLYVPIVGSLLITLYLTVVPWHFTGQNYGIALVFLRRRGIAVDPGLKRSLYVSFVASYAMTLLGLHGEGVATVTPVDPSGTVYHFLALGIPGRLHVYGVVALAFVYLGALLDAGLRLRGVARPADLLPAAAVVLVQGLWFTVPIWIHTFVGTGPGLGPLAPSHYAYTALWVSLSHAVQYLWITSYYAERRDPGRGPWRFLGRALLAGAALYGLPTLLLAPGFLGRVPYHSGLLVMMAGALNLHHVLRDSAIWKLRSGPIARILIRGGEGGGESAGRLGRPGPAGLAWLASGALGAALMTLGTLEYEFGFIRAHERGDLARLESAAERLAWLGRDDPKLRAAIGTLRAQRGDRQGALASLRESLALLPTASAWVDIGVVHERAGEIEEALRAYEAALALHPSFDPALRYASRARGALASDAPSAARQERAVE